MNPRPDKCPTCGAEVAGGPCRQCLLRAGLESTPGAGRAGWTPPAPEELEAQLSKYQVLELIGQGGMGAVYKGWQTSLERDVAIKVLPPALMEDDFTARFKQEARTMARLSHPAIVNVYDFDETPDGLCYIVMEFMEGTDVQRMIGSQEKLPAEHALAITLNVCDALSYAHEHGVIHRDIKPANVMVDREGRVKVADFGLAKVTQDGAALLTGTNVSMGTPGYVAPEILIAGRKVDARADVYALGVMLYAMLTGNVPQGRFQAACECVPGLDPRFDDIVNRAMQNDREARYGSAAELHADLTKILTGPVERASAEFAQAASSAQLDRKPPESIPVMVEAPSPGGMRAKARMALIGLAVVVCVLGLFVWKPWSHKGGQVVRVAGAAASNQGSAAQSAEKLAPANSGQIVSTATGPVPQATPRPAAPAPTPRLSVRSTPTPTPATPVPDAPPKPETVVEKWFAQVDGPQEEAFQKQVIEPYATGVASLRVRYLAALDAAIAKASAANQLADALAWRAERRAFENSQDVAVDDAGTPAGVKTMRADYRQHFAKLNQDRISRARALLASYDAILAQNQALLTQRARLDEAVLLKNKRDEITRAWLEAPPLDAILAMSLPATKSQPFVNSLGMKFVPVPIAGGRTHGQRVLFSVWDTRVSDYEVFAKANKVNDAWTRQAAEGVPVGRELNHPVAAVSWEDAQAFCQWLTERETAEGRLPKGMKYRLPTDEEWSWAVGLPPESGATPTEKSGKNSVDFPWGKDFPPKEKVGNYADEALHAKIPLKKNEKEGRMDYQWLEGYTDGYATTSPVGSFPANGHGLYDMGGNVWQWCEDWSDDSHKFHVLRGASWTSNERGYLLSSVRAHSRSDFHGGNNGFRCVLAPGSSTPTLGAAPAQAVGTVAGAGVLADGFTNTLGMQFKHVSGTNLLFCIHTTRRKDYAAYFAEVPGVNSFWKTQPLDGVPISAGDEDPVVSVTWDDAIAFCAWLSKKEGRTYRLPTDWEWSFAVGIGPMEQATKDGTPESLNGKIPDVYPWGNQWPPPKGAGNYADTTCKEKFPTQAIIEGYTDGFPTTSPVMSFTPNKLGLYDMGGNVSQWCEDWLDEAKTQRVTRGGSWNNRSPKYLLSSGRIGVPPNAHEITVGFRIVVESPTAP